MLETLYCFSYAPVMEKERSKCHVINIILTAGAFLITASAAYETVSVRELICTVGTDISIPHYKSIAERTPVWKNYVKQKGPAFIRPPHRHNL